MDLPKAEETLRDALWPQATARKRVFK